MAGRDPERLGALVLDALLRSGCRGIVATGWGGMKPQALPEQVFALSEAPHEWLFPRVAAVVHHGGAGTTAAGLRAGKPSVICPFFADQPFWGRQVHRLGAGPEPIAQKRLTSERLAQAITHAVTAAALSQAARNIQRELQAERAIETTVAWVERWMGSR